VTRPSNQPVRACIVGTPATGKSDAARLIAKYMDIPYEIIDCSAFSNFSMANTQLFGSGPGYVDSYKVPRLMKLASHHQGCVVEISDLDHASQDVRHLLAENFLQILQTGTAQSGSGTSFSCATVLFLFSLNLPDGADEKLSRKLGFGGMPSAGEMTHCIESELKLFLSGAFLSRIGKPILFKHLSDISLARIIERSIKGGVITACENLGISIMDIRMDRDIGKVFLSLSKGASVAFGARRLEDIGRKLAGDGVIALLKSGLLTGEAINLNVRISENGKKLVLEPFI